MEADKLFAAIGGADVAMGSRWLQRELQTERQPWYRQLYGRLFNSRAARCARACNIATRNVASSHSRVEPCRRSLPGSVWNGGASIRSCCSWRQVRVSHGGSARRVGARSSVQDQSLRDGMKMMLGEMLAVRWNDIKGLYENPSAVMEPPLVAERVPVQIAK